MNKPLKKSRGKIYLHHLGCPKLDVDNSFLQGGLEKQGLSFINEIEDADAVIISTCAFIEDARIEAIDAILEASSWKAEKSGRKLYVTGCLSSRYGKDMKREIPEVDEWFSFGQFGEALTTISSQLDENSPKFPLINAGQRERFHPGQIPLDLENYLSSNRSALDTPYAYLKISEGCNRKCAYCAIPEIRGPYRSRPQNVILEESRDLINSGVREIIVIAQEVNSYGLDLKQDYSIEKLLNLLSEQILSAKDKCWLRIMYTHPPVYTDGFIKALADNPVIVPYLDFPVEHADDKVLEYMRRRTTWKSMRGWIDKLREAIPDIALRTSVIVGHPGEGSAEFSNLIDRLEEVKFERLGVFKYSPEEGTQSLKYDAIDKETAFEREQEVLSLAWDQAEDWSDTILGKEVEMIIEEETSDGYSNGRTFWDAPDIDGQARVKGIMETGDIIKGKIIESSPYSVTLQPSG